MRAVVLTQTGGPDQLRLEQVKTPVPEPGQVRVALRASALNRRDVWISLGLYPRIQLPCILGSDGTGIVDQVGSGVDENMVGREVVIYPAYAWGDNPRFPGPNFRVLGMPDPGTFADFICVPVEHIFPKPIHLDWEQAAAIPLAGLTSWRAVVTQAALQSGEKVLVTGIGGGVATLALKWAVALGAQAFVTSGHLAKIDRAMTLGAIAGVNYHSSDWARQALNLSGGLDVIIDGTGGTAFNDYLSLLKPAGRMVVYGATAGNPVEGPEMARLFFRQLQIRGSTMGSLSEFSEMLAFVAAQHIEPVIDQMFPLEEASAAHRHLQTATQMGKVVLRHA